MARSLGTFAADLIGALGGKPTPQGKRLFESWQRWEGGHTANAATWNPLNLTAPGSGLPTINEVGVVAMPSYRAGVGRTAGLIERKYPAIAQALRSGQVNFENPQLRADLNMWLSGKGSPDVSPYVRKIAGSYGSATLPPSPAGAASRIPAPPPPPPSSPELDRMALSAGIRDRFLAGQGRIDLLGLPSLVRASWRAPAPVAPRGVGAGAPSDKAQIAPIRGKGILAPAAFKKTHDTDNLGWPAVDLMGAPGTAVRSPVAGTVVRHGSAQGGEALYLDTDGDGQGDYWAGHVTDMLPVGSRVRPGQVLARVSPDHPRPHVHWAKR